MANRYWVASTSGNWSDTANWSDTNGGTSGFSVPDQNTDVYMTNNSLCVLDQDINIKSWNYAGNTNIDANDYNVTVSGACGGRTGGDRRMGSGTWSIGGNFNFRDGRIYGEGSTLILSGNPASVSWSNTYGDSGPSVTIASGADITVSFYGYGAIRNLNIYGHFSIAGARPQGDIVVFESGRIYNGWISWQNPGVDTNFIVYEGGKYEVSSTTLYRWNTMYQNFFMSGIFDTTLVVNTQAGTYSWYDPNPNAGTILNISPNTVLGKLQFSPRYTTSRIIVDCETYNGSLTLTGDLTYNNNLGVIVWNNNNTPLLLSGVGNQYIDYDSNPKDVDINKSAGSVTLTSNLTTDSLTLTDGTLDISGYNFTTTGNFTQGVATIVQDSNGSGLITVGGDFRINGSNDSPTIWNDADLNISGSALATNITVSGSNASSGTYVTASRNSIDNGDNVGWTFRNAQSNIYKKLRLNSDAKLTIKGN